MTNAEAYDLGLRPFVATAIFRTPEDRDCAAAQVRALIPANAQGIQEREHTRCSGCGDHYCPADPAMFMAKWFA